MRIQMHNNDTTTQQHQSLSSSWRQFRQLPLKVQLGSIIGFCMLVGPLLLIRSYIHEHDSFAPSLLWQSLFITASMLLAWLCRSNFGQCVGWWLLFSVSAGVPRYVGEHLHAFTAIQTVIVLPISRVAESPLAPRCRNYVEIDLPNHLVGWLCGRKDLPLWPEGKTIALPVTKSWFGSKVVQPVVFKEQANKISGQPLL